MKLTLKIYQGDDEALSKVLEEGVYRIGRSEFSDIVLDDDSVSRSHLEIRITSDNAYFTNMSSSGKVKVNNQVLETAELADGDIITIGVYRLYFYYGERDASMRPAGEVELPNDDNSPLQVSPGEGSSPQVDLPQSSSPDVQIPENDEPEEDNVQQLPSYRPEMQRENEYPTEGTAALNRAETVVEMKPVVAKLLFTDGPRKGEELFLESYEVSFGRSKKADIFLDDEKLSRKHAKIARVGMGYRLIDLNSRNGTYVNGVRVLEHPLSSFDTIEMGSTKIKFLVQDIISGDVNKGGLVAAGRTNAVAMEQTKSLQIDSSDQEAMLDLQRGTLPNASGPRLEPNFDPSPVHPASSLRGKLTPKTIRIMGLSIVLLLGALYLLPSGKPTPKANAPVADKGATAPTAPPASVTTKEYLELSADTQRAVEGYYTSALRAADQENYEDAIAKLKKIHEVLPYYKQSKELLDQYTKRLRERQIVEAADKAKKDEKQELALYLEDGVEYLKQGDFDKAAEAFNSAITFDPNNQTAIKGLKAAEYKIRNLNDVPPDRDPEKDKVEMVRKLFERAVGAFSKKSYQEAIDTAEEIRKVELKGETEYLNEAKQIIDRSRMLQKEEFEPFLTEAKEKYAEGDYNAARDLCEEMLKRNPAYDDAKDLLAKTKKQLNRLAKEAYVRGYILESMSRIDEAKQYWNRAKNYVRPGDDYYDKVNKKLDQYQ
jgi:pSer/pThr/pTyr-binding forkhead associated (FHA) protein/tetratricopeptide (TPR) repeat protein